jgi:hypothetical protein
MERRQLHADNIRGAALHVKGKNPSLETAMDELLHLSVGQKLAGGQKCPGTTEDLQQNLITDRHKVGQI